MIDWTFKKNLKGRIKVGLNSAAYTEGVVRGVLDNLLTAVARITKNDESEMNFVNHCPKNFECNLLVREYRD